MIPGAKCYTIYMIVLNKSLEDTPVMSLQTGGQLGITGAPIIDPRKLQVLAFYVSGQRIHETSILHTSDVREIGPLGMIVNAADDIMPLDQDLVRLQEVVSLQFSLLEKTVIDDTKRKLGKVREFSVESDSFFIQKLYVSQSIMKNISNANLIIDRGQIIEITDKIIVVRSATAEQTTGLAQLLNPFRKSQGTLGTD